MGSDLFHQLAGVVVDRTAFPADHVEVVVRVGNLPPRRVVDPQVRLAGEIEVREQGQGAVDG